MVCRAFNIDFLRIGEMSHREFQLAKAYVEAEYKKTERNKRITQWPIR